MQALLNIWFNQYSEIFEIIGRSVFVSLSATTIAAILGISSAIPIALREFRYKKIILRVMDTFMSIPPVLMGLVVYLLLSRRGPLGEMQLLFTTTAMIIAQTLLVFPIIFGLTISSTSKSILEIEKTCRYLGADKVDTLLTIIKECKIQLFSVVTAGFGRAISEVGAVMMVGGNIKGSTRVMTTYIALETGKGNFSEAIIIGGALLFISFMINMIFHGLKGRE